MSTDRYYELTEALSAITFQVPFVGCLLYDKMQIHTVDKLPSGAPLPTLATDGNKIYINKEYFVGKLVIDYRMAAISHEVLHAMFFHPAKMLQYMRDGLHGQPFDAMRFNIAADYIINAMLKRCELGVLHPDWLWSKLVTADDRVEDIYARLTPPPQPTPPPSGGSGDDDGDDGSSPSPAGGSSPSGGGEDDDDGKWTLESGDGKNKEKFNAPDGGSQDTHVAAEPEVSEIEWKTAVAGAAIGAKAMGKLHGDLERFVDDYVEPKQNWMEILRDSIVARAGFDSVNWRRSNKRKMRETGVCYPTRHSWDIPLVAIIEDCSGSISSAELALFRGSIVEILTQCTPRETILMSVDTQVNHHAVLQDIEDLADWKARGGGGTNMEAGFKWLVDENYYPDVVIVLTDGHTQFTAQPDFPVTWVSTDKEPSEYPYGTAVKMEVEK